MSRQHPISARRHRITLMGEERTQGAGGRTFQHMPIIADVWAAAEGEAASSQTAGGQALLASARFITGYDKSYLKARFLDWRGIRYRVTNVKATGVDERQIEISARQIA